MAHVYDHEQAIEVLGGDERMFEELARMFVASCESSIAEVRAAAATNDPAGLYAVVHSLRGALSIFAKCAAEGSASTLEQRCMNAGAPGLDDAAGLVDRLVDDMRRLCDALKAL